MTFGFGFGLSHTVTLLTSKRLQRIFWPGDNVLILQNDTKIPDKMIKCQQPSLNERIKTILWTFTTIFSKCQLTTVIVNILLLLFKNSKVLSDRNYVPWVEHHIIEILWQSKKYRDIKFTFNKKKPNYCSATIKQQWFNPWKMLKHI